MKTELFPDATVPTSGRTLAMKLVLEGMKLQPCRPTLLQARDAIIDADLLLTQGDNYCEIWKGFAKRGLGTNALQGTGTTGRRDGFDVPEECT